MRSSLCGLLILILCVPLGCTNETDPDGSSESETASSTIPFTKEGELAVLQESDTLVVVDIEIAETDSARQRGMMEREGFPDETSGMLFPFDAEETRSFWMANTPVALDLFFIDANEQIVSIAKYAQPNTAEQIRSEAPAQFVLETPAGFADSYGIVEGDRVTWSRLD